MSNEPLRTVSSARVGPEKTEGGGAVTPPPSNKNRAPRKKAPVKIAIAELQLAVTHAMNRDRLALLPAFPTRFYTIKSAEGLAQIVQADETGVCRASDRELVSQEILRYVTDVVESPDYKWTERQAVDAARFWHKYTPARTAPAPLLWADQVGLCYHRLPWDSKPTGRPTPLFDEIMSRCSNARALQVWIGSLFDPKADLQQYVWLYGQGGNSKGALMRFLERVLGPAYMGQQPPERNDKFWTYSLRDKRLIVFPDCNNTTFVTTGLFKSLTGGDAIRVEGKGKDATSMRLSVKFLFSSNSRPRLSSERADQRRIIFCELGAVERRDGYEDSLWLEGGDFLKGCVELYRQECPASGPIGCVEKEGIEEWTAVVEEEFQVAFDASFVLEPVDNTRPDREKAFVKPKEFQTVLRAWFEREPKQHEFREWIERRYGVRKKNVKLSDGSTDWRYLGVSLRVE